MTLSFPVRAGLLGAICLAAIAGFFLANSAIPQPHEYHDFADQRPLLGVPHMMNVVSNLPFLIVGLWGLAWLASGQARMPGKFIEPVERWPYWVYFTGLTLTAIGSAYYHAAPGNDRLTWDRMPLTIAFMGLFTAMLAERLDVRLAGWLLGPMVAAGIGSVVYWHVTEMHGAGDLRPYFVVQFLPMLALPLLLLLLRPRYTGTEDIWASLACYVLAKVVEILDRPIYAQGGLISGHTVKHLIAGLAAWFILFMLQRRRPRNTAELGTVI